MTVCVLLPTTSDRIGMVREFFESLVEHEPGRHLHVHLQDDLGNAADFKKQIPTGQDYTWQVSPRLLSAYGARVAALKYLATEGLHFDHYVNVDDDLILTPDTRWQPAIDKTDEPGVGFVLTNWVRHRNQYAERKATMREEFIRTTMIYNGGGMAYNAAVADLVCGLEVRPSQFEDLWPITAYRNGYLNYRYRGSLAIHRTGSRGGRQKYVMQEPRPPLCEKWIRYRYLPGQPVGRNLSIPMDSDILPHTHAEHRAARAERGWA